MLARLCASSFVRNYLNHGYIVNQLTRHDRIYDESGYIFLRALTRGPQLVEHVIDSICASFVDAERDVVAADVQDFLSDLAGDLFIVLGETAANLDESEPRFKYQGPGGPINWKERPASLRAQQENRQASSSVMLPGQDRVGLTNDTTGFFLQRYRTTPILYSFQIEMTTSCNERCLHCYMPPNRQQRHADTGMVLNVIRQFAAMGGVDCAFSGGEPMLHPDFAKCLLGARELDLMISVLSNLTALDDNILAILKEVNVSDISASVYSTIPEEHDHITGVSGSHKRTTKSIMRLIDAAIPVQISCPTMRTNYRSYQNVARWASSLGLKSQTDFIIMARHNGSTDNLEERLNAVETEELIRSMIHSDPTIRDMLEKPPLVRLPEHEDPEAVVCSVGMHSLSMAANGTCYPCAGWQSMVIGDLRTELLADIWRSSPALNRLRGIKRKSFPDCLTCKDRDYCAICFVRNANEAGGDPMAINPLFCKVAEANHRIFEEYWDSKGKNKQAMPQVDEH